MSGIDPWLASRLDAAPRDLAQRIRTALAGTVGAAGSPADWLHAAAERLLHEAKSGGSDRSTALTLLAADALETYACEWTAEFAPDQLGGAR